MAQARASVPDVRFSRVSKNGGSRCVVVPRELLEQLAMTTGDAVELWIEQPAGRVPRLCIARVRSVRAEKGAAGG